MGFLYYGCLFIITSSVAFLPTLEAIENCFKVEGLIVPAFTPQDYNGALNLGVIGAYAQYLSDVGVDGVLVGATTGEGPTLNLTDNKRLVDAWIEAVKMLDLFVIVSVGGVPLPDTLELAAYAAQVGASAVVALPEVYYKPQTVEELVYNIELIAQAANGLPLVYDDIPEYSDVTVDIVEFVNMITPRAQNFRGVKTTSLENLLLLRTALTGQQKLYFSNTFYLAPAVCLGIQNYILAELNYFPRLIIDIIRYREKGNITRSTNYFQRLLDLIEIISFRGTLSSRIAAEKAAMEIITGIEVGTTRPPIPPLSYNQIESLIQDLQQNNVELTQTNYCTYD